MPFAEIKALLKDKRMVIGTDRVLKLLKTGKITKVFAASNANPDVKRSLEYYAELSSVEMEVLDVPNDELGTMCKKPFSIMVIGIGK